MVAKPGPRLERSRSALWSALVNRGEKAQKENKEMKRVRFQWGEESAERKRRKELMAQRAAKRLKTEAASLKCSGGREAGTSERDRTGPEH